MLTGIRNVRVQDCVHYRGYRYGGFANNVYEDYMVGVMSGMPLGEVRQTMLRRVLAFDGRDFGAALSIQLGRSYAPWRFPWTWSGLRRSPLGQLTPSGNPDIVCHVSSMGVLASHINREFAWLDSALMAMRGGYKPEEFGFVQLSQLRHSDGRVRYLVLDGNHRVAAMHSLGVQSFKAMVRRPILADLGALRLWPGVLLGPYLAGDAAKVFCRYFVDANFVLEESPRQKLICDVPIQLRGD